MDRLKTLRSFSWSAVERQAEALFASIRTAQLEGKTNIEYEGHIHQVNAEILRANGFVIHVRADKCLIAWTAFSMPSLVESDDDDSDSDDDEGCCSDSRKCCPCPVSGGDNLKHIIMTLLSSLDSGKK
jgi:hypothetical protein